MSLRRLARSCVAVAAVALLASPAGAKNGAQATILTHVPTKARAGTTFRVAWTVTVLDNHGGQQLFGAGGMFVRLLSPARGQSVRVYAQGVNGRYHATVPVPRGGMRGIQLGFRSWTTNPKGGMLEGESLLPITNNPFRSKEPGTRP